MIPLSEAQVKKAVEDHLQYLQNQGKLIYFRLNAGQFIMGEGKTRRVIRGTKKGTADLLVITNNGRYDAPNKFWNIVTFIECKSSKGKQTPDQFAFQEQVESLGCSYYIVKDAGELESILN